ncbi:toll-Interleukin receptor [Colwellia sp. Bg11-28]|nr:toll-Interleukin receptor [Colwellia sp. Bg11-28]
MPLSKKIFISYCHKDEAFKEDLVEHLSSLKRNGDISIWNDRDINAGDKWKDEIDQNLEDADMILFLITPSFLASEYCFEVEAKRAFEKEEEGTARLIPIAVRDCVWTNTPFGGFQGLPKDGKAVKLWDDTDTAWKFVVEQLAKVLADFKPKKKELNKQLDLTTFISANEKTLNWLDDTELSYSHRKVDNVLLSHIYVTPDLMVTSDVNEDEIKYVNSEKHLESKGYYFLLGEEQQGKTTLLKNKYKNSLKNSVLPVYIDIFKANVNKSDLSKYLKKAIEEQYDNLSFEQYIEYPEKILLLDNLDKIKLNNKALDHFFVNIESMFNCVVITAHDSYAFMSSESNHLSEYHSIEIQNLGHVKREEMAKKWLSLGVEETINEHDLYKRCEEVTVYLNSIIRKNIMPAKPVNILMLMQILETNEGHNLEMTSHGHCYQKLIYQHLEKANVKDDSETSKCLNFLTELAWSIFNNKGPLNQHKLEEFGKSYNKIFLPVDPSHLVSILTSAQILKERDGLFSFSYPYIYYFFSARKIAEGYSNDEAIRNVFSEILNGLHREDFANIVVFITHHSKEPWVTENVSSVLSTLFSTQTEAMLTKEELSFMDDFIGQIPDIVMETKEVEKVRALRNQRKDEIDRFEIANSSEISSVEDDHVPKDILASINKTFKGMDVAGQIIKNRHASLTRDTLYDLAQNGTATGLRFLDYFISISDATKVEIVNVVKNLIEESPTISDAEINDHAKKMYYHLIYGVVSSVIKKIASSVGSKEAFEIYKALEEDSNSPALTLIRQSIDLQFNRKLDTDEISKTAFKLKNNSVCTRILKEIVVQHTYMFPVEYQTKQKLENLLGISTKRQRQLDLKTVGKG